MPANHTEIEKRLWEAADRLRANSKLKASEYSVPVLGLIFLRYADFKFAIAEKEFESFKGNVSARRQIGKYDYQARGVLYLPPEARYDRLLNLPEGADVRVSIEQCLERLPNTYTPTLYRAKCDAVYQHVFDSYYGDGRSVYAIAR